MDVNQFIEEVMSRLMDEHGVQRDVLAYLIPKITVAFDTEHAITPDQMNDLFHGDGDNGVPEELQELFPLLNAVALSPYTDVDDKSAEVDKVDIDDDFDDSDEDDEDEGDDDDDEED